MSDLFDESPAGNAQAYSVSELAFALRRTLEEAYGFVRLRGEISKVTNHASGHIYLTLKDDKASLDAVVWRMQARLLNVKPQNGMEVVVTGRVTTYPAGSRYQLVIETLAPAGVGALLAQLERLKTKLAAEGLFEAARKKPLPAMPRVVGVITSPTGAVLRDILHRITDRWPCRVVVWPVVVQGEGAAYQVRAAIDGFGRLSPGGRIPRPDVLIVARGGGSVEDLWPFNDETLARAIAACPIPVISAVGHETDTTLIDFVSDRRAPTPTAAAEMATPVFADLAASIADYERRLLQCGHRAIEHRRTRLSAAERGLPSLPDLIGLARQRLDIASGRLGAGLQANVAAHGHDLIRISAALKPGLLERPIVDKRQRLSALTARLRPTLERNLVRAGERLEALDKLRLSLNPDRPLDLGFARVHHEWGALARGASDLVSGEAVKLKFKDGERGAVIDATPTVRLRGPKKAAAPPTQGDLF